jgi:hypothetical protein
MADRAVMYMHGTRRGKASQGIRQCVTGWKVVHGVACLDAAKEKGIGGLHGQGEIHARRANGEKDGRTRGLWMRCHLTNYC